MTVPVWVWAVSAAALIAVVAAGVALTDRSGALTPRRALGWVAVYGLLAAAFGLAVGVTAGWVTAGSWGSRGFWEPRRCSCWPWRSGWSWGLFAFDSIPAVFGITTAATLVVACNAFALMGLRQLYALLAGWPT